MPLACEVVSAQARTHALPSNFQISALSGVICPRLELFDAHLFQEPASLDFLRRHDLKPFNQLSVPVVAFHSHQCAARLVYPQQYVGILRLARRRVELKFPALPSADTFLA